MLSDAEIDRYARQIVLPEVGGRGQERLLGASVSVLASDAPGPHETAVLCALHLAVAGVGRLALAPVLADELAPALAARCPTARVDRASLGEDADATIAIGAVGEAPAHPTLLATVCADAAFVALPRGRCRECVATAIGAPSRPDEWPPLAATILAPLAAALALRGLLALDAGETPRLVRVGLDRAGAVVGEIPARTGCDCRRMDAPSRIG